MAKNTQISFWVHWGTFTILYYNFSNVKIFYRNYEWDYMLLTMEDISGEDSDYQISGVYHDKSSKSGGRVRVIVVTKKVSK